MTGSRFLLDTNILIAIMNRDATVEARLANGAAFGASSVAIGELYFGAARSDRQQENLARVDRICAEYPVFVIDPGTAREYGHLKARLFRAGTPIPENDLWIAAIALQNELTLVTRDRHFNVVSGLRQVAW